MAKKDIVVYKVLEYLSYGYRTPFRWFPMRIGNTYVAFGDVKKYQTAHRTTTHDPRDNKKFLCVKKIDAGYIHSYTSLREALNSPFWRFKSFPSVIVECVIPKGTLYYKSYDSCEIASRKLHIVKIVVKS